MGKDEEMSDYEMWMLETIAWYEDWCRADAARIGYPGKIKFSEMSMRSALESYEEALEAYREFKNEAAEK